MSWEKLAGNPSVKRVLSRAIEGRAIHGSYIFAGPRGVGKYHFAIEFAKALNCPHSAGDACDQCAVCKRIGAAQYLDVATVRPDGKNIKVDQVRDLIPQVFTTPTEGPFRIFILDDADALNDASSNALLKTLEEPPPTSVLILVVTNLYSLLPTIRSRSQVVTFAPLSFGETAALLSSHKEIRGDEADLRARLSGGRPGIAISMDVKHHKSERDRALALLRSLAGARGPTDTLIAAGEFGLTDRDQFESRLQIAHSLLHDVLYLKAEFAGELINDDISEELAGVARAVDESELLEWYETIRRLAENLRVNINTRIAAEGAFAGLPDIAMR